MRKTIPAMLLVVLIFALTLGSLAAPVRAAALAKGGRGLSQAEIDGLLFMREEEKLARDVYLVLYGTWQHTTFANISTSESTHMAAIKTLLDYYGLQDPAAGKGIGEFTNQDLQALYIQLVAQGSVSLTEGFKAGGAIEEIDILDLEEQLQSANHNNIVTVYNRLLDGSCNHLRAFVSAYEKFTGSEYQPQYLPEEVFQAIMDGTY